MGPGEREIDQVTAVVTELAVNGGFALTDQMAAQGLTEAVAQSKTRLETADQMGGGWRRLADRRSLGMGLDRLGTQVKEALGGSEWTKRRRHGRVLGGAEDRRSGGGGRA